MRRFLLLIFSCFLLFFTACVKVEDTLTIHQDGSGTIELCVAGSGDMGSLPETVYPPLRVRDAFALLPIEQFKTKVAPWPEHDKGMITTATFPDLATLLASPYARAHRLSVQATSQGLLIQGASGMELAQVIAAMKKKSESEAKDEKTGKLPTESFKSLRWNFKLFGPDRKAESKFNFADNEDVDDLAEEAQRQISIKIPKLTAPTTQVEPFLANLAFDQVQESEVVIPSATIGSIRDQTRLHVRRIESVFQVQKNGWNTSSVNLSGFVVVPEGVVCLLTPRYYPRQRSIPDPHLVTPTGVVIQGLIFPESELEPGRALMPKIWGDGMWRYPVNVYFSVNDPNRANFPTDWRQAKQLVLPCLVQATATRSTLRFSAIGEKDAWDKNQRLEKTLNPFGFNLRTDKDEKSGLRSISTESQDIGGMLEDLQLYDAKGKSIPLARLRKGKWLLVEEPKYPLSLALRLRKPTDNPITLRLEGNIP